MLSFKRLLLLSVISTPLMANSVGCSTLKSALAVDSAPPEQEPIASPFAGYTGETEATRDPYVVRSRKGNRSVEVQLPSGYGQNSDFVVPMNPSFRDPASADGEANSAGYEYRAHAATATDREVTAGLTAIGTPEEQAARARTEQDLGLVPTEDRAPASDQSYLAEIDVLKHLFKEGRFEAALLESDGLLKDYPTDPKLYEMRGTLFDRMGRLDLALRSWEQSIRLNRGNESLRRFLEHKRQKRSLASP